MSQNFKLNFDEMREGILSDDAENSGSGIHDSFSSPGNVRNLCFVWPDGRMKFLNYAYLVSGEYDTDNQLIELSFTTEKIILKGINLVDLYSELLTHKPKTVYCINPRYNLVDGPGYIVNEIMVILNS